MVFTQINVYIRRQIIKGKLNLHYEDSSVIVIYTSN